MNPRQIIDYRAEREDCLERLLAFGKTPDKAEGYATTTVDTRSRRMDQFYRWVCQQEGGYTANVSHDHADGWMRELAQADCSSAINTPSRSIRPIRFRRPVGCSTR